MLFDLQIFEDGDPDQLIASHASVDVTWTNGTQLASATRAGLEIALPTWDDYPITIYEDCIEIAGRVGDADDSCGYWVLRASHGGSNAG